ncbi:iron chaperone [Lactococcus garvieae]|uniref:YdhG-like domain-containing protein n=1 Tax=Lactococcus garvieae DCC43 TaxID=1231377 RepID=K2PKU6_9LACT|nr:DUF1801 domain-containing protein [Lactococcus garvieae]EKF50854.1 hypothetical protein C426_1779 [Lactococcus garvieae DCC43]
MEFETYFQDDNLMILVRKSVLTVFPQAQERLSYGMPAWFDGKRVLLYAQNHKAHLRLYPRPAFIASHLEDLTKTYNCSKGTIQITHNIGEKQLKELVKTIILWNLKQDN